MNAVAPQIAPDAESVSGLSGKGLGAGTVGLVGAVAIGLSCIAPAYTLTESLGPVVERVGPGAPAVLLVGFVPMLLVAFAYRELNARMPDSGTSFTWVTRAFGPWIGWMAGWGLAVATIIVLSNLAGVAVDFFYLALSQLLGGDPEIAALSQNRWINVGTCLVFVTIATAISYRDMRTTQRFQYALVGFQVVAILLFAGTALWRGLTGTGALHQTPIDWQWFNPLAIQAHDGGSATSALIAGLAVSVFVFWGWDVTLTMTEETKGSRTTPGKAATVTIVAIMVIYLLLTVGLMTFAGVGTTNGGLADPAISENVFFHLAHPVLGGLGILVSLTVLSSAAASLQSTFVSPARTLLAMSHYGALPPRLSAVHPRFFTPGTATIVSAAATSVFYVLMRLLSQKVLTDTVTTLGAMVCFYYGLTALAALWYFRRDWFTSPRAILLQFLFPLVGGLMLAGIFVKVLVDSWDPGFGSGSAIGGVGLVFVLTIAILLLGVVVMAWQRARRPEFFTGRTLPHGLAGDAYERATTSPDEPPTHPSHETTPLPRRQTP